VRKSYDSKCVVRKKFVKKNIEAMAWVSGAEGRTGFQSKARKPNNNKKRLRVK
jgi:hypothetical protein